MSASNDRWMSLAALLLLACGSRGDQQRSGGSAEVAAPPVRFRAELFLDGLPNATGLAVDRFGNLWVSKPEEGAIALVELKNNKAVHQPDFARKLRRPFGLAVDPKQGLQLYFAEEHRISVVGLYSEDSPAVVFQAAEAFAMRGLAFGDDGRLYAAMARKNASGGGGGAVYSMKPNGSDARREAESPASIEFVASKSITAQTDADGRIFLQPPTDSTEQARFPEGRIEGLPQSVRPAAVAAGADGVLWLADRGMGRIFRVVPIEKTAGIQLDRPSSGDVVGSPLRISGAARGSWFFEGTFPVKLLDGKGSAVAQGSARATSDWMTTEEVPFEAELRYSVPAEGSGTLVLEKANPSGLPANAAEMRVPVRFEP